MKPVALLLLLTALFAGGARGQILNGDFEQASTVQAGFGGAAHWSRFVNQPAPPACDTDFVGYDSAYFRTLDAHSGTYAVEIRNARCSGVVNYCNLFCADSEWYGAERGITYTRRPSQLTFWYKYFPVGNDTGRFWAELKDAAGHYIGYGFAALPAASTYQQVTVPLVYDRAEATAKLLISVATGGFGTANYGTRLLIDDIQDVVPAAGVSGVSPQPPLQVWPNPTSGAVHLKNSTPITAVTVTNALGARVCHAMPASTAFDVALPGAGLFFITIRTADRTDVRRVLVQ